MPVHSNPIGLENKTNGHTSTVNLRIKIPPSAVSHLETLAKKSIDNPLRKIGIVRVCVDGINSIEIPTAEAPKPVPPADDTNNNSCLSNKQKRFSQALTIETNTNTTAKRDSNSASSNNSSSSLKNGEKKEIPRSKDVLPLGPSYIRYGAISPKPVKKKRDPSSHPPFDCDLPLDLPPPPQQVQAPLSNNGQTLMAQLSNQNGSRLPLPEQSSSQGVISTAIIMSSITHYEQAIEAVINKAVSGQDLRCYLVEMEPNADLDSIPPATPKSVDLNPSESSTAVASIVDQNDVIASVASDTTQQQPQPTTVQEQPGTSQVNTMPPTPTQMPPPPPQTMANPALVVRTGPHQVPQMPGAVMASPHGAPMGMHARGAAVWGYDASAPSPHGAYILASPGDAAAMGFAHDPIWFANPHLVMAGRHPSPVKLTPPMMTAKMPPQSPSYAPMMYGGHSPYGRMPPTQPSPYGHGHPSPMAAPGQFSPSFAMTSPIPGHPPPPPGAAVMQPAMTPYGMVPQMGKTQAQMMQQQHSPIAATVSMHQMVPPPPPHSHAQQQQHQMSKDFLPSLQHAQPPNSGTPHSTEAMMQHHPGSMTPVPPPMTSATSDGTLLNPQQMQHPPVTAPPPGSTPTMSGMARTPHSQQQVGRTTNNVTIVSVTPASEFANTASVADNLPSKAAPLNVSSDLQLNNNNNIRAGIKASPTRSFNSPFNNQVPINQYSDKYYPQPLYEQTGNLDFMKPAYRTFQETYNSSSFEHNPYTQFKLAGPSTNSDIFPPKSHTSNQFAKTDASQNSRSVYDFVSPTGQQSSPITSSIAPPLKHESQPVPKTAVNSSQSSNIAGSSTKNQDQIEKPGRTNGFVSVSTPSNINQAPINDGAQQQQARGHMNTQSKVYLQTSTNQTFLGASKNLNNQQSDSTTSAFSSANVAGTMSATGTSSDVMGKGKSNVNMHMSRTNSVVTSGSLPFGHIDDDIGSEASPFPTSPAPSVGSVKHGQQASSVPEVIGEDQTVAKLDDMNLEDLSQDTRRLLTDVVVEFEKNRVRSDDGDCSSSRMVTPVNIPTHLNEESLTNSETKVVTEVRIPTYKTEQVMGDTISVPKTVPVINTSANVAPEKKEKKKRESDKSKKANNGVDDKKQKVVLDPLKKFPHALGNLDTLHSNRDLSSSAIDFGSSFDSQNTGSSFSSAFFGSNSDANLFSSLEPDSLFNSHDFDTTGSELMSGNNFMPHPMKGSDLEGVGNDEHCGKLLAQIMEGDGSGIPVSDFNDVLGGTANTVSRANSHPAGFTGNSQMKGIHGISDSFGISENDINLLQQSMDMAQASSQNNQTGKARKRTKSTNASSKAFGEPNPKVSVTQTTLSSASPQKATQGRAQISKSSTPTPASEFTPPGTGTPENQLSKSNPESSFSSMKFESVINKVLSEKGGKNATTTEATDLKQAHSNSSSPSYDTKQQQSKYQESVQRVSNAKSIHSNTGQEYSPVKVQRLGGNTSSMLSGGHVSYATNNDTRPTPGPDYGVPNKRGNATTDFVNYASNIAMNVNNNSSGINNDHQYIRQSSEVVMSTGVEGTPYMQSPSGGSAGHNTGGFGSSHSMDPMTHQQQIKFFPSLASKSSMEYSSSHMPGSPHASKYGSVASEGTSFDLPMRRTIFVPPQLTNNSSTSSSLITTSTGPGVGGSNPTPNSAPGNSAPTTPHFFHHNHYPLTPSPVTTNNQQGGVGGIGASNRAMSPAGKLVTSRTSSSNTSGMYASSGQKSTSQSQHLSYQQQHQS
ncbi:uncharacterized protein LOC142354453 isoform X3 [Convolutriloba macropyga]